MEKNLEELLLERIKRKIEPNLCITPQTTPIVFFGDYDNAKACTVALHPSEREFLDGNGQILTGNNARLCSRKELGKNDLCELEDGDAEKVLKCCENYFKNRATVYTNFFYDLDCLIRNFGYSYYDNDNGSNFKKCVNLNLGQWASSPRWGKIKDGKIISEHLKNDLPTLKHLLEKRFECIFLDGDTVVSEVKELLGITLKEKNTKYINHKGSSTDITIYIGEYNNAKVIGWSAFLPSQETGWYHLYQAIKNVL